MYHWWRVDEETPTGWNSIAYLEGDSKYSFRYFFPHNGKFRIWHQIKDSNDLTDDEIKEYLIDNCRVSAPPVMAGGGHWLSGPGGREKPIMQVEYKKKYDKKKTAMTLKFVKRRGTKS